MFRYIIVMSFEQGMFAGTSKSSSIYVIKQGPRTQPNVERYGICVRFQWSRIVCALEFHKQFVCTQ